MAATKQKADTVSATLDRIDAKAAEIKKGLEGIVRTVADLEKRIRALETERGAS
jgi:archaellum component FlaC